MTDLTLYCLVCQHESGTRVVCEACQPGLNNNQKLRAMRLVHKLTYDRDGGQCVHCGHSAAWEAGELGANHVETQGSRPDLKYDLSNTELVCVDCNRKHADRQLPSQHAMAPQQPEKKAQPKKKMCSEPRCIMLPLGNGKCLRHQPKKKSMVARA